MKEKAPQIPTIYTVATAHLDTSWHWTLERTIEEYLPKTLEDNFALFEQYPDYTFSFEGAYRYALMEEYYPELFEKLKGYIAQGRWRVAGSAWENGDTNIPSPEALLRNILIGNRYFQEKFGVQSCDIYLPDCFGFGWALPGLAAHANLKGFTTQKLTWGSAGKVPFALGRWLGPDGGEILVCPDGHNYAASLKAGRKNFSMQRALARAKRGGWPQKALILHGVGDQGGAPREESVQVVCGEIAQNDAQQVQVCSAGSDQIFRDLYDLPAAQRNALPAYRGEWLLSDHGVGCYTSRTWSKRWNRQAEQLAFAAERACSFAGFMGRMEYPKEALNDAWKRVIAHQFHDDMTGTSNEISYQRNWDDLMASQQQFAGLYTKGISAIINTMHTGFAVGHCAALSNMTQWERRECLSLRLPQKLRGSTARVYDADGRELPSQLLDDSETLVVAAAAAPMSVTLLDVQVSAIPCQLDTGLRVSAHGLENRNLIITIDANGDIASLYDKRQGREMLQAPVRLALFKHDGSPFWPAWELYYPELKRRPEYVGSPVMEVIERGPARAAVKITREARGSQFTQVISLDCDGTWVRVANEIDWRSLRSLLKVEIQTAAANPKAAYDLGYGVIQRGNNKPRSYEVPAQQWADITDKSGAFGLSVLSDSKTGWDKPGRHTLRLTAVYSPRRGHRGDAHLLDFGRSRFDFGLYPHNGEGGYAESVRAGACFGQGLTAFWPAAAHTDGPTALRFGRVNGMVLRALKQSEDNPGEWVIRVQEANGTTLPKGVISLGAGLRSFREIYASEEPRGPVNCAYLQDGALHVSLRAFELRSFALTVEPMEAPAAAPPVPLELPVQPCALLPGSPGVTRCAGQVVALPAGRELRLSAAAFGGDRETAFLIGGTPYLRKIYDANEAVGAGDLFALKTSGYVKPAMPVREFTHMCGEAGEIRVGVRARFYEIALPLPGTETTLTLPRDEAIVLLEGQVYGEPTAVPAHALFDELPRRTANELHFDLTPAQQRAANSRMRLRRARFALRTARSFVRLRLQVDFPFS